MLIGPLSREGFLGNIYIRKDWALIAVVREVRWLVPEGFAEIGPFPADRFVFGVDLFEVSKMKSMF